MDKSIAVPQETARKVKEVQSVKSSNQKITSEALFNKLRELVILHEGEEYKLRITSNNKLILTK